MHGDGRAGMAMDDADQAFCARNGISNALGREPRAGRAGSMVCLSSTGLSWWGPESSLSCAGTGANLALLFPERHRECSTLSKS